MTREEAKTIILKHQFAFASMPDDVIEAISYLVKEELRCKECKWWKDSDGKYRRGIGAESQCPINTTAVYCGEGYCYKFSPKADMRGNEE